MLIHLNGWPGAGKLTVGRELARLLGARLLDNHTLHNIPLSLCDRGTEAYWNLYYRVRELAYGRMREMPAGDVFVLTNALTREAPREIEAWAAVRRLAAERGDRLVAVTLDCELEENLRRVQARDRLAHRKLVEPAPLAGWRAGGYTLQTGQGADHALVLDNTRLSPLATAELIRDYLQGLGL